MFSIYGIYPDSFPQICTMSHLTDTLQTIYSNFSLSCTLIFICLKRFAVITLLPILLFNTLGYYLVFYGDLLAAKHEAEVLILGHESLGDKMVSLTFPLVGGKPVAQGLTFTDDDEFMYQGRMYDVAGSSTANGQITYKCYTDNKETALNDNLSNKINADNDSPSQNHKNNSALKEFVKDYTLRRPDVFCISPGITKSFIHISPAPPGHSFEYRSIVSPPPEPLIA